MKNQQDIYISQRYFNRWLIALWLSVGLGCSVAQADETEIFTQNDASAVNNNILFLLDVSGSMKTVVPNSGNKSRLQVLQETFKDVINKAPSNVNIGLAHYANSAGPGTTDFDTYNWNAIKGMTFPVSDINTNANPIIGSATSAYGLPAPTPSTGIPVRSYLSNVVDGWTASGYTPIVDALYEVTRYFRGEVPVWGGFQRTASTSPTTVEKWHAHPSTYVEDSCAQYDQVECNDSLGQCGSDKINCQSRWMIFPLLHFETFCQDPYCKVPGTRHYKSPIQYTCQANYLVLMSDGKPEYVNSSSASTAAVNTYPQAVTPGNASGGITMTPVRSADMFPPTIPTLLTTPTLDSTGMTTALATDPATVCSDAPQGFKSGKCGAELTRFLAERDQAVLIPGTQTVKTYTIGFGLEDPAGASYLASLATVEGGAYTAQDHEGLTEAFNNILSNIQQKSLSFSSPAFSVDEGQFLSQSNNVFVPVFDSSRSTIWSGNLRKYRLNNAGTIVGKRLNGAESPAFNDKGSIDPDVMDLWSSQLHGTEAAQGGAASKLPKPNVRKIYTNISLTNPSTTLREITSTDITAAMLTPDKRITQNSLVPWTKNEEMSCWGTYKNCYGATQTVAGNMETGTGCVNIAQVTTCPGLAPANKNTLINYALGYVNGDSNAGIRYHMGDTLNSKPVSVNYGNGVSRVFLGTNEGYLHSLDADTGVEKWAYIPQPLLKNISYYMKDESGQPHLYGIDGPLSVLRKDINNDGIISSSAGDQVLMFFGLRRGGRAYFALDITDPNSPPTLKWAITPSTSTRFANLGETWSKPTLSRLLVPNSSGSTELKDVLVFGGGYDPVKEKKVPVRSTTVSTAELGSDVYIVDLATGNLIWSLKTGTSGSAITGSANLKHGITGDIRILDMDGNGALDRLYFADTGGNVWRVDMHASATQPYNYQNAKLTQIASLGGGSSTKDYRKFFYEPDTGMRIQNGKPVLTIALGSGYRAHPLDTSAEPDRFYVLIDPYPYEIPPSSFVPFTEANLKDANTIEASKDILSYMQSDTNIHGWYMPLNFNGEKVLSSAFTFLDKVMFTSFSMSDETGAPSVPKPCEPGKNTSRAYIVDLMSGRAVLDLDKVTDSSGGKAKDKFQVVGSYELMEAPQLVFGPITGAGGAACTTAGQNCQQNIQIQIGKFRLPLMDVQTASSNASSAEFNQMIDVTRLLPRMYWLDNSVTGGRGAATAP